jgi:hypothetical protein
MTLGPIFKYLSWGSDNCSCCRSGVERLAWFVLLAVCVTVAVGATGVAVTELFEVIS